ncbi:ribonuclease R [Methylovirgula sp. 4M-Z18]|uniref:ribonuclease R n=1 Tax=Methylovirgula sp. 4M-Z18 TaxID=2293567 RepID=UPI000E2FD5B9|nr:ribonuclease R [Methylovirgula sp. 4M-Z18]RFB80668.1 ribonuclease R [Methylovirgula sp. 4M-Z18]
MDKTKTNLPTRDQILAFIARTSDEAAKAGHAPTKIGKREIARAFDIKGSDRIWLKAMLKDLEGAGDIESRGRRSLVKPGHLPPVVAVEIVTRDADGELIAEPFEWDKSDGPPPRIAVHVPRRPKPGTPIPGIGERALIRTEPNRDPGKRGPAYTGRVIKILPKAKTQIIGIFRSAPGGGGRILPIDKKAVGRELIVPEGAVQEAQDGDLVAVDLLGRGKFGPPGAAVKERLGSISSEKAISLIAIHIHRIPNVFSPGALAEAEKARQATLKGREDWRKLPLVTIDPPDAKDHDDAVHAEPDTDPNNQGGFIITVAIADVAAYVTPHSALDREALERGNSVYFPDRVVPMLPERISNDLCSLRPNVDRPALAVRMVIAPDGRKKSHTFHRIMMRSAAKLSYQQAQDAIDGVKNDAADEARLLFDSVLKPLWAAYACVKKARDHRGPLELDLPERKLQLRADGTVERVLTPERLDAHRLIEECMILANVAAAETLEEKRQPLIYRAHDEPTLEKLNALSEFLKSLDIRLAKGQVLRPAQFNGILAQVKDTENENLVNEVVLRSQAQAEYTSQNYGHFGLNLRRYAHFTSPIRRYADLIVHRALIRALHLGDDGLRDMTPQELDEIAEKISAAERRAMIAERETTDRLIAAFLSEKIGATFEGRISGVTRAGLFVKLSETGADGFVPAATLGRDYYRYEESAHALVSTSTGEAYQLGDMVDVKLVEAAPFAGALRFEMLSHGQTGLGVSSGLGKKRKLRRLGKETKTARTAKTRTTKARPRKKGRS